MAAWHASSSSTIIRRPDTGRAFAKAIQNGYGIPMKALMIFSSLLTPR